MKTISYYFEHFVKPTREGSATKRIALGAFVVLLLGYIIVRGCMGPSSVTSLEDVARYAPGTWTGYWSIVGVGSWHKLVLNSDGTGEQSYGLATADNWSPSYKTNWEPTTGKYLDTGKRWYGITEGDDSYIFLDSDTLELVVYQGTSLVLKRGDEFPFSK